ncbi:MAG: hypothetical protein JNL19_10610 [Burkholderiales bacterium]|nr:hypothetical protein [Burkholderiales bacterium]
MPLRALSACRDSGEELETALLCAQSPDNSPSVQANRASPAPPIWAFVERHRFDGKQVVLFNTINSHFGDEHIARLREKVMSRGARSFEHRHVLRGRMTQQLTADEMLRAMDEAWFAGAPATPPGSR